MINTPFDLDVREKLSEGYFGQVWSGLFDGKLEKLTSLNILWLLFFYRYGPTGISGKAVAVKIRSKSLYDKDELLEADLLSLMDCHDNIVQFHRCFLIGSHFKIVMELCDYNLKTFVQVKTRWDDDKLKRGNGFFRIWSLDQS